ncbi:PTS sugar transporter subunit IIA [Cutibacterium sp. V947]|uniref:PTS sugar transporter subunit IIA n=1 Tax=Cutibacterium sp. V947 TaxID=3446480 RepID=UPI003EE1F1BF
MSVLLNTKLTSINIDATDRDHVLTTMADQLDESGVTRPGFLEALLKREKDYPTGLPVSGGVAIPHTDPLYVTRDALAVTTLRTPVLFGQMGGSEEDEVPVSVVILMALSNADDHLSMLQNIVKSIQDGDLMKTIRSATEPEEIVSLVRAMIPSDAEAA